MELQWTQENPVQFHLTGNDHLTSLELGPRIGYGRTLGPALEI